MTPASPGPGPSPPGPEARLEQTLTTLSHAIAELIQLSAENRAIPQRQLDILRLRRQQLSAVIDGLTRFVGPGP